MLLQLLIRNIALIDQLELSFGKGLHVLTGETGAGKSIIVDAVSLLLGGRADRNLIRTGCDKAYSEALFHLRDCPAAAQWLHVHDLEPDDECVTLSREINQAGRSVCRIQGISQPLNSFRELAGLLMDLHGQHEHQSLLDDKTHLSYLDSMGDDLHQQKLQDTAHAYYLYREAHTAYAKLKRDSLHREEQLAQLLKAEEELSSANLTIGEEDALTQERDRYRSSEKITRALREASAALIDAVGGKTVIENMRESMRALSSIAGFGQEYAEISHRAEALYYDAEDLGFTVRSALDSFDDDPERASWVDERLDLIRKLSRKFGATTELMLAKLDEVRAELAQLNGLDVSLEKARKKAQDTYRSYLSVATELTAQRKRLAADFEKRVELQLADLNMRGTRFYVNFSAEPLPPSADGVDRVCFLIAPNAGEEKKPLSKIASGGELSRVMLALKALSAEHALVPSMIFDEIDTGISGRTAQEVAQKMGGIARYRQVLCVTHLQQIAAMATHHFLIQKAQIDGRTLAHAVELDGEARVAEIARMLSGVSANSESGLTHARHMLAEAAAYRERIKD